MKRVYSAQNTLMVDHLKLVLDSEGIGCEVRNRHLSIAAGRLPPIECWTELWVEDEQYARAEAIVKRALETTETALGTWVCRRCGEQLEDQFEACWKCCTTRDAPDVGDDTVENASESPGPGDGQEPSAPASWQFWILWGAMALAAFYVLRSYSHPRW